MPVFWFENVKQALARGDTQCFASIWCLADVSLMSSGQHGVKEPRRNLYTRAPKTQINRTK